MGSAATIHHNEHTQRHLFPGLDALQPGLHAGCGPFRAALPLVDRPGRGTGRVRHQLGGQLAGRAGKARSARHPAASRHSGLAHEAWHRQLRLARGHRDDPPRGAGGLRRCADVAAFLLQGRERRRHLPLLCLGGGGGGRQSPACLPVSHPARVAGAHHPGLDRAVAQGLSRHHCWC